VEVEPYDQLLSRRILVARAYSRHPREVFTRRRMLRDDGNGFISNGFSIEVEWPDANQSEYRVEYELDCRPFSLLKS